MSLTIKRLGADVHVLHGAETLPDGEVVELFTAGELSELQRERLEALNLQMPSFIRGDEDEDAEELFKL
ncbi:hypothetical protein [Cyanobium sp. Morenito 9A2]|uniref:hypothetical protein n=1 Tax=Cyanobium sp. Morenito 9A2 TaxID=2823718 RepID=UPI0020CF9D18|nr:hypothetical protein [Cyanobium sp. Morenito 9A2]MCP9848777.1 hypothetical protein [Cyanobium sp. Morenito 9A2]